jgi:hypothetical protein
MDSARLVEGNSRRRMSVAILPTRWTVFTGLSSKGVSGSVSGRASPRMAQGAGRQRRGGWRVGSQAATTATATR